MTLKIFSKVLFALIMIFGMSVALISGCDNRGSKYYEEKAKEAKIEEEIKRKINQQKLNCNGGVSGSIFTREYNGHDYVVAIYDRGCGITHSASCHCMKKENK